ncbi:MAG: GlxA family transcriptional regulator [Roseobacter sp.]
MQETNTLSLAAAVDPMRAANRQAGRRLYDWVFLTPSADPVILTSGLVLPAYPLATLDRCDLLLVIAGFDLEAQSHPALLASIRRLARTADCVAGIDGGPWIMAAAGLLDGHDATTHWEDLEKFAFAFPEVRTLNARFVESGARLTSGGAAPALDMMLHLIALRNGAGLADRIACSFIYNTETTRDAPQQAYPAQTLTPLLRRAHRVMSNQLDLPLSIPDVARSLGVSLRRLQLHFNQHLKVSPQQYYLRLRLTEADRRVTQTEETLQAVALATGFRSQSSFARAFARHFGQSARSRRAQTGQGQ